MAKRTGPGRPSKLTPEVQNKLVQAISDGNYYRAACAHAGISYDSFARWLRRGEAAQTGEYYEFAKAIRAAEAAAEIAIVALWRGAMQMPQNWAAARDFLARRFPDRWAKRETHTVEGSESKPIVIRTLTIVPPTTDDDDEDDTD